MPRIPSSSSVASSSAHWVSTPPRPTWAPTCNAMATRGAYRRTPRVVSSSANPRRAPSAASAATWIGLSRALVECPWFAGVRRARIFCIPCMISTTFISLTTSRTLAGVRPLGTGSNSLSMATRPFSGHSSTNPSRLTGRASRISVLSDCLPAAPVGRGAVVVICGSPLSLVGVGDGAGEQAAALVDLGGLADQGRADRRRVGALQPVGHLLEGCAGRGPRAQRVLHREHLGIGDGRHLGGPAEVRGQLGPAAGVGELCLQLQGLRGDPQVLG